MASTPATATAAASAAAFAASTASDAAIFAGPKSGGGAVVLPPPHPASPMVNATAMTRPASGLNCFALIFRSLDVGGRSPPQ